MNEDKEYTITLAEEITGILFMLLSISPVLVLMYYNMLGLFGVVFLTGLSAGISILVYKKYLEKKYQTKKLKSKILFNGF